jgi:tetratricopeptide (TPR) repeat protein
MNTFSQKYVFINDHCIISKETTSIAFLHINSTVTKAEIEMGDKIGTIQKLPDILSKKFNSEIKESQALYAQRDYSKAAFILENAYESEPENLFIAENYARALYNIDSSKAKAFEVYKRLIDQLNTKYNEQSNELKIDVWHRESYWKLATLYLDHQDYESAIDLLIKFQLSIADYIGKPVYNQVLDYMTECTFYLNEIEVSKKLAQLTLKYDPENSFIKELLKKMT